MQIIYLEDSITILLFMILWFVFQAGSAALCYKRKDDSYRRDSWLYKTRDWEQNGYLYEKYFKIKWWKKFLPDGAAVVKKGYRKRHLSDFSKENLEKYVLESRRAECSHWLAILPFWVFGFFAEFEVVLMMLGYALAVNLPCIIAQRYNRPRVIKLLKRYK